MASLARVKSRAGALAALLIACAAAPACGETASRPDPTAEFVAWERSLNEAFCSKSLRCADERGPSYSNKEACIQSSGHQADYARYYLDGDHYGELTALYHLASPAIQKKCLSAIASSACGPVSIPDCDAVLVLSNPLREGEPCGAAFVSGGHSGPTVVNACGPGLVCDSTTCPVCVKDTTSPPAAENEPCSSTVPCASGLECVVTDGETRLCKPPAPLPGLGEACDFSCLGNYVCIAGTCAARGGVGDDCDPDEYSVCMFDLHCDELSPGQGVCRPYALEGEPCSRFASTQPAQGSQACVQGLWCVFDKPDAKTGVCGGAPVLSGPMPCSGFGHVGDELLCPVHSRRDTRGVDDTGGGPTKYCMCLPYVEGGACEYDYECPAGMACIASKCALPAEDGKPCSESRDCASEFCDLTKGRCASNSCPDGCPGVNRNGDIFNCGDCGHTCDGVATLGSALGVTAFDATGIYVVGDDGAVMIPLAGGDPVTLANEWFAPQAITTDQDNIYIASDTAGSTGTNTGKVMSLAKSGGSPVVLATGEDAPSFVTVDSTNVYWVNAWQTVRAVPLSGGTPTTLTIVPTQITSLVSDGSTLYLGTNDGTPGGRIASLSTAGGGIVTLATSSKSVEGVTVDAVNVYFASGGVVAFVSKSGGSVTTLATDQGDLAQLCLDGSNVYWATNHEIASTPIGGGPTRTLLSNLDYPRCIGVDATSLYWSVWPGFSKAPIGGVACRGGVCQ
jgi:hypothetical protein